VADEDEGVDKENASLFFMRPTIVFFNLYCIYAICFLKILIVLYATYLHHTIEHESKNVPAIEDMT
jgi:hypothetical protein